jgi:hypothetical protein
MWALAKLMAGVAQVWRRDCSFVSRPALPWRAEAPQYAHADARPCAYFAIEPAGHIVTSIPYFAPHFVPHCAIQYLGGQRKDAGSGWCRTDGRVVCL